MVKNREEIEHMTTFFLPLLLSNLFAVGVFVVYDLASLISDKAVESARARSEDPDRREPAS